MEKTIFVEAFRQQFLPVFSEITLPAMHAFGGYDLMPAALMALAGSFIAVFVLFRLGRIAAIYWKVKQPERFEQKTARLRPYATGLMLLVTAPAGFAVAFAAGLLGSPSKYALPLALLGLAVSYGGHYL